MVTTLLRLRVDLLLLIVAIAWGSTYLTAKELITPDSVVAMLAVRMLAAAALMATIVAARRRTLTGAELRIGGIMGLLLSAVFLFETFGIAHTSATNAGLIISLTIVFTPLLDSAIARRRLPGRFLLAAAIAVVGVALLAGNGAFQPPSLGDLLVLLAAIVRAAHVTSMHRLTDSRPMDAAAMDSLHLTTVQLAVCALVFTTASTMTGESIPHYLSDLQPAQLLLFAYLVLICTVFAFFVQTWAVRRTSPSRVSLLLGTEPIWAALIGVTLAGDVLRPIGWIGVVLILVGTAWGRTIEQAQRVPPPVAELAA